MTYQSLWAKDHFLLMRIYTDLKLLGYKPYREYKNISWAPFGSDYNTKKNENMCHIAVYSDRVIQFLNHVGIGSTPKELTSKNYLSILNKIIQ